MKLPIPVVSVAERKVNTNLNGRQATATGQHYNPSAVKYPYATHVSIFQVETPLACSQFLSERGQYYSGSTSSVNGFARNWLT
jgi:hypothetical protein